MGKKKEYLFSLEDLKKLQALSWEEKVNRSTSKILEAFFLSQGKIAVSFSGGKDSCVLLDMVAKIWAGQGYGVPLTVVFANTRMEHAGMSKFVKEFCKYIEEKHGIAIDLKPVAGKSQFRDVVTQKRRCPKCDGTDYAEFRPLRKGDKPKGKQIKKRERFCTCAHCGESWIADLSLGYPIGGKQIAKAIRTVREWVEESGVDWSQFSQILGRDVETVFRLRGMGCPDGTILYLTGINSSLEKSDSFYLSSQWWPLCGPEAPPVSEGCCEILKEEPIRLAEKPLCLSSMVATMAADSQRRKFGWMESGCNAFDGEKVHSKPMSFWLEQDVLEYHAYYNLPHFQVYGDLVRCDDGILKFTGEARTGCKLCLFGCQFPDERDRMIRLQGAEPQTIEWAMKPVDDGGLGYAELLEFVYTRCWINIEIPQTKYTLIA